MQPFNEVFNGKSYIGTTTKNKKIKCIPFLNTVYNVGLPVLIKCLQLAELNVNFVNNPAGRG